MSMQYLKGNTRSYTEHWTRQTP